VRAARRRAVPQMQHPNVLRFVGVCCEPPNLCIVAEYLTGGSVFDLLHGGSRLPAGTPGPLRLSPQLALQLAADVAAGMEYLHSQVIIHRDLKSANLLLDQHDRVKVADFGVARRLASTGDMTAETGTYRWMAPEVIKHAKYDQRIDVYSFGIILWELFTSQLPYDGMPSLSAAAAVVENGLRPAIPAEVPPAVAGLMQRCWAGDATQRPQFVQVVAEVAAARAALGSAEAGGSGGR
jgi:serine/threonine protein kinase